jgi:hypothetical protein
MVVPRPITIEVTTIACGNGSTAVERNSRGFVEESVIGADPSDRYPISIRNRFTEYSMMVRPITIFTIFFLVRAQYKPIIKMTKQSE